VGVPNNVLVSKSILRVQWSPSMVMGYPNGRMDAVVAAAINLRDASITLIGLDPQ